MALRLLSGLMPYRNEASDPTHLNCCWLVWLQQMQAIKKFYVDAPFQKVHACVDVL